MENLCIFKFCYGSECDETKPLQKNKGQNRIKSIIKASKAYKDELHVELEKQLANDADLTISYHKNCVSRYTSSTNVSKYVQNPDPRVPQSPKILRRSCISFDYFTQCLYCAGKCQIEKDGKHPDRWKPAYLCRSTQHEDISYKEYVLAKCKDRNDKWAREVTIRVQGAISDLHAVEARYHKDCISRFFSNRLPLHEQVEQDSSSALPEKASNDLALIYLINFMSDNKNILWNSIELLTIYQDHGGVALKRPQLIEKVQAHFAGELIVLSSPGYCNILAFQKAAAMTLKIVKDDVDSDIGKSIKQVAEQVSKECRDIVLDKTKYQCSMDTIRAEQCVSSTLQSFLVELSPKLNNSLPALMIGNMITGVLRKQPTDLQIALGLLFGDSKLLLGYTYDYGITCSYDEVRRFKKSAAVAAAEESKVQGISSSETGLVQIVMDNFDTDISSPNGKLSTHSLAMILMQPSCTLINDDTDDTIPRIKHDSMSLLLDEESNICCNSYVLKKNPSMPEVPITLQSADFTKYKNVSVSRAKEHDFEFLKDVNASDTCPEYNGYNTKLCREQGHALQPKTKVVYMPMINTPPAEPSTVMTAMLKAKHVTESTGQKFVILTADLQLYRIAVYVLWENQAMFNNFYIRLGGMHFLMSYIGCIGTLMADSGIVEILSVAFGGVLKMLNGKKFPENIRALRMLVEEVLRTVFDQYEMNSMEDLECVLQEVSLKSRTAKLWINCLIKPVFLIMQYVRAERESDWPLHIFAVKQMMPLFFAAGHFNYARFGLYYLKSMESLPEIICEHFMKGKHTMHHNPGLFNGIWSDMAIETTYMKYGHGKSGVIGVTLKPETLKTWAYSLHACSKVINSLTSMRKDDHHSSQTKHKEEMEARIKYDAKDRKSIRQKLEVCIDPLNHEHHRDALVNIVTGKVVNHPAVNVDNAVSIGENQMKSFEKDLPTGFHNKIQNKVTTMALSKKHIKIGDNKVFNTETIYARAMGLQNSVRNIDSKQLLAYELSPYPCSMFEDNGNMRDAKTKSLLKNSLKVESSGRLAKTDVSFLDGCAVLWIIAWPPTGTVQDFLDNFRHHIQIQLVETSEVYLIFDRYKERSIKECTRNSRDQGASRVFTLRPEACLPPQKTILTVSENKKQLISLIVADLLLHKDVYNGKLVITGNDPVPYEINSAVVIRRQDMAVTHDEADTIIINQIVLSGASHVLVVADDTDVFVLLCHFVFSGDIKAHILMVSPIKGRAVIDINETVKKHHGIMGDLLAAHGITGCDTVATYFGIGKGVALKVLRSKACKLSKVGNLNYSLQDAIQQATKFMLSCYGQPECETITEARQKVWLSKVSRSIASAPKLQSLPPTNEALRENVARAHLQVAIWRQALECDAPAIDPLNYGWEQEEGSISLKPKTVSDNVALAPADILQMVKCSCESKTPCKTRRCGCNNANMPCSTFCKCQGGDECFSSRTREHLLTQEEDTDTTDDEE